MRRIVYLLTLGVILAVGLSAQCTAIVVNPLTGVLDCTGAVGPTGATGATGAAGANGTNGTGFTYRGTYAGRPGSPSTNDTALFTDGTVAGICTASNFGASGSARATCTWNGSIWDSSGASGCTLTAPTGSVNIGCYGVDKTGATDSAAGVQTALNDTTNVPAGYTLYFPCGTYLFSTDASGNGEETVRNQRSISFRAERPGCVIFNDAATPAATAILGIAYSSSDYSFETDTGYALTASTATIGSTSITLTTASNASNFTAGSYAYLRGNAGTGGVYHGEPVKILANGNTSTGVVTLQTPLVSDYSGDTSPQLNVVASSEVVQNVEISGINWNVHGQAIIALQTDGLKVHDSVFNAVPANGSNHMGQFNQNQNTEFYNNRINFPNSVGLEPGRNPTRWNVHDNVILGAAGITEYGGSNKFVHNTISCPALSPSGTCFSFGYTYGSIAASNNISVSPTTGTCTGAAVTDANGAGSPYSSFKGNTITVNAACSFPALRLATTGTTSANNTIIASQTGIDFQNGQITSTGDSVTLLTGGGYGCFLVEGSDHSDIINGLQCNSTTAASSTAKLGWISDNGAQTTAPLQIVNVTGQSLANGINMANLAHDPGVILDNIQMVGVTTTYPGTWTTVSGTSGTATCLAHVDGQGFPTWKCLLNGYAETGTAQTLSFPPSESFPVTPNVSVTSACGTSYLPTATTSTLTFPANASMTATTCGFTVALAGTGGGSGSSAFNAITSGTNTSATMTVGSGATITPTGTGVVTATALNTTAAGFVALSSSIAGYDSTNTNFHVWNGADALVAPFQSAPTTGHCVQTSVVSGKLTLVDSGSSNCGGGGSVNWNGIGNPTGALSLTMGANTSLFSFVSSGSTPMFKLADSGSGTGTAPILQVTTAIGSTAPPFQADANGVGFRLNTGGSLQPAGTGSISFQNAGAAYDSAPLGSELTSAGACPLPSGWTGSWSFGFTHTSGTTPITCTFSITANQLYQVVFNVVSGGSGGVTSAVFNGLTVVDTSNNSSWLGSSSPGTVIDWGFPAPGPTGSITFVITPATGYTGVVQNISVKAISGTSTAVELLRDYGTGNSGVEVRPGVSANFNTLYGQGVGGYITTGSQLVGVGYHALQNDTTGFGNVAIGSGALAANNIGGDNVAAGRSAMIANTTGGGNAGFGTGALGANTTGYDNAAVGDGACGGETTSNWNTCVGAGSLQGVASGGGQNTAVGGNAGRYITGGSTLNTTGSFSTFIGQNTQAKADGDGDEIVIGANTATGNGSHTATIGSSSTTANYIFNNLFMTYSGGTIEFTGTPTSARTVTIPDANSNTVQGIANPSDSNVINYISTDGVQHRISTGTGTVTVVSSGSLTSTALVTGGGSQTVQTPSATATLASNGNISTPGTMSTGVGGSAAGAIQLGQGTAPSAGTTAVTIYAPSSVTSYLWQMPAAAATGIVRGSNSSGTVTISQSELSGDATTSGSNAVTVVKINGTAFSGANGDFVSFGASNVPADSGKLVSDIANFKITGPTAVRTFTLPDANSTITTTVANGTSAMGTSAISSGTCASVVTTSASGVATTDSIVYTPNTDPTAITGYAPSANGSLYIWAYPTSGNVNFKVCNNTSASVTPSALTLNWRVTR